MSGLCKKGWLRLMEEGFHQAEANQTVNRLRADPAIRFFLDFLHECNPDYNLDQALRRSETAAVETRTPQEPNRGIFRTWKRIFRRWGVPRGCLTEVCVVWPRLRPLGCGFLALGFRVGSFTPRHVLRSLWICVGCLPP